MRTYELLTPGGAYVPSAMPGTADLTIKMKKVNPDVGVPELEMAEQVRWSTCCQAEAAMLVGPVGQHHNPLGVRMQLAVAAQLVQLMVLSAENAAAWLAQGACQKQMQAYNTDAIPMQSQP
jgi:hypothetical protein